MNKGEDIKQVSYKQPIDDWPKKLIVKVIIVLSSRHWVSWGIVSALLSRELEIVAESARLLQCLGKHLVSEDRYLELDQNSQKKLTF